MSFKDEYSLYQQNITPDENFLNTLAGKMERQQQKNRRKKALIPILSTAAVCGAAAAVVLIFNIGGFAMNPPNQMEVDLGTDKINYITDIFSEKDIFEDCNDIPKALSEMLLKEGTVLYKSDKNTFDYSGKQERNSIEALALKIGAAVETSDGSNSAAVYYMAVDNEGNVVKFTVSGDILVVSGKNFRLS